MPKVSYLPPNDYEKSVWLKNFAGKLSLHASTLGLLAADVTAVMNDSLMYTYSLDQIDWFKKESAKRVAYKKQLADGEIGSTFGAYPVTGASQAAPTTVPAGVFKRTAKLVQRIKNHANYNVSIGEDLGIESHATLRVAKIMKPELKITINAGHPVIKWKKKDTTAADLYVDRGDEKGFNFLTTAIMPHYTDIFNLPTGSNSAVWNYKAIYRSGDAQTGEFSNPVSITISRTM